MRCHQLRALAEKGNAILPVQIVPDSKSLFGRRNRAARMFAGPELKFAQHQPSVRWSYVREMAIGGIDRMAMDKERVRVTEPLLLMR